MHAIPLRKHFEPGTHQSFWLWIAEAAAIILALLWWTRQVG